MTPKIVFKDERLIDVTFTINLNALEEAVKATKDKLEGRNRRGRPRALNAVQVAEILQLIREGKKKSDIATQFGVSNGCITKVGQGAYLLDEIKI